MADERQPGTTTVRLKARGSHAAQGRQLARTVRLFLRALGQDQAEVSVSLVGDQAMRRLNRETRGIDRTTDVLSFPAARVPGSPLLGDLVISVPVARHFALRLRRRLADELALYAAHGLLHLLGHQHRTARERRAMGALESKLLGEIGLIARAGK